VLNLLAGIIQNIISFFMDIGSIIIAVVFIGLFVGPVIYLNRKKK